MHEKSMQRVMEAARALLQEQAQTARTRELISALGHWLIDIAAEPSQTARSSEPAASSSGVADTPPAPAPTLVVRTPAVITGPRTLPQSSGIVPLKLGDTVVQVPVQGTSQELGRARTAAAEAEATTTLAESSGLSTNPAEDLSLIEKRCRIKAASCRLYMRRRAAQGDPGREPPVLEEMTSMLAQAKAMPGCFLWVFWKHEEQPPDDVLEQIAQCYEGLADAARLLLAVDAGHEGPVGERATEAMHLMARCTSALRVALGHTWLTSPDADQDTAHNWLRRQSALRRVYIAKHMRLDDPAKPETIGEARTLMAGMLAEWEERAKAQKRVTSLISTVRYHAKRVVVAGSAELNDLFKACDALAQLEALGVRPEDDRVLEALGASTHAMWTGEDPRRALLDRALHAAQADTELEDAADAAVPREWSTRVKELRAAIRGTTVVLIGGERRSAAADRIREAFELAEVEWIRLNEHTSGAPMAAPIARANTSLVIVLVKLTGHLHAEEASGYARKHGKPCVYLKAGYNPEQIADATLSQAGTALGLTPA